MDDIVTKDRVSLADFSKTFQIGTFVSDENEPMRKARLYNAGGGEGRKDLNFNTLQRSQHEMYKRTLTKESEILKYLEYQEKRQVLDSEKPTTLCINVSREEFPDITANFTITFAKRTFAQLEWEPFIRDVQTKLRLEYIHSILERASKLPIFRILSLRDGGEYLVR